jgi:hypothetical protein
MNGSPSSNSSSNSIPLWVKVLVPLGVTPSIASIYYAFTRNPLQTVGVGILALLITTLILIWLELQKELVRVVTDRIKDRVKHPLGFKTYYCKSLPEKPGIKEVVSVISGHTLELEQIFINPRIVDISPHSVEASPALLPASSVGRREEPHSIWDFLTSKETAPLLILNAAGMGKSTLLRDIALTLADPQKRRKHNLSNKLLPFLLFLSEFDFNKQFSENEEFSLADAVEKAITKRWDKPPSGWVEYQLKRGRCFILLDGLDEIADPNIRHDVMKWIPIQMDRYPPSNRLVITSRPREYLENPLERKRTLEIQGFNNDEIVAFISKSYQTIGSDAAKVQDIF